eukprot:1537453-Amphidinium_carterae.1
MQRLVRYCSHEVSSSGKPRSPAPLQPTVPHDLIPVTPEANFSRIDSSTAGACANDNKSRQ